MADNDKCLSVWVPQELADSIQEQADEADRTFSGQLRYILRQHVAQSDDHTEED